MYDDDLPILPREDDTSLATEIGRTAGGFAIVALFFVAMGVVVWILSSHL